MKTNPLISIIVPVYNKEQYLQDCVDSLVRQTYSNLEIILVDDESTDNSGKICDEYAKRYGNVTTIHKPNGGPSSAWKAGFKLSQGEYIAFVDSDDYVDDSMIEEMAAECSGIDWEIITSDYAITKDDGSETYVYQKLSPGEYLREDIVNTLIKDFLGNEHRSISFSRCMKLISRKLIEDNFDYCDERVLMGDDSTIILPCLIDAKRIYVMDRKVYYHYRYINDSIVHRYDAKAFANNRIYYEAIKKMLLDKFKDDENTCKDMVSSLNKEEVFLLLLLVKNEVRGNADNCLPNLAAIRKDEFVSNIINTTRVTILDKANKLLYMVLKNPSKLNVEILKLAFKVYYR